MEKFKTELYKVDYKLIQENNIDELKKISTVKKAAGLIKQGQLVAFPTETVYGLGADATNEAAVKKIYQAKGRPQDNPLIVHIASFEQLKGVVQGELSSLVKIMADKFWPGPLTVIFSKTGMIPYRTTAGLDSVAVRMPSHPLSRALIEVAGVPIAAPSANKSGAPSPTLASHVMNDLAGKIPLILDGGPARVGVESTVVDLRGDKIKILRPGGVSREDIIELLNSDKLSNRLSDLKNIKMSIKKGGKSKPAIDTDRPISPGMKYRHYSPETPLFIIENEQDLKDIIASGLDLDKGIVLSDETYEKYKPQLDDMYVIKMGSRKRPETVAAKLFELLRNLDTLSLKSVYIEAIPERGIGEAVMNRLYKASSRE